MAADGPHKLAFVFGPVGWQRENMGRALYDKGGVYRAVFDEVARECRPALPDEISPGDDRNVVETRRDSTQRSPLLAFAARKTS